jgi:predicted PurR-regulated permease PerM
MSVNLRTKPLLKGVLILFVLWLLFAGIYYGRPFLVPLAFAGILAMLLWPITRKLESWKVNPKLAALISVLLLVGVVTGVFYLLGKQIQSFSEDLPQIQQQFEEKLTAAQEYLEEEFGVSEQKQEEVVEQSKQGAGNMGQAFAASFVNLLVKTLLMLVYIFLFLLYRHKFKNFIIQYTPEQNREKARNVINNSAHVAKSYLSGRLLLMLILAVAYCTGLSVIGIQQPIFFGVLAAILGIVPFVGNILGAFFPLAMALLNEGTTVAIWVVVLFTIVQLIENYLLEPLVVGKKVDLNGFFAIAVVVLGEILWGLSGAILAMPLLGIAKIIFDNIKQLRPLGYLMGEDNNESDSDVSEKLIGKVKGALGKE